MTDRFHIFRQLACSDVMRKAAQAHVKHQPIQNDDRINSLLERLSQAKLAALHQKRKTLRTVMQIE